MYVLSVNKKFPLDFYFIRNKRESYLIHFLKRKNLHEYHYTFRKVKFEDE